MNTEGDNDTPQTGLYLGIWNARTLGDKTTSMVQTEPSQITTWHRDCHGGMACLQLMWLQVMVDVFQLPEKDWFCLEPLLYNCAYCSQPNLISSSILELRFIGTAGMMTSSCT